MFIIEKPKQIHLSSWKKMFDNSQMFRKSSENNFDLLWNSVIKEESYAFSAKNEGDFLGFTVASIYENYKEKYLYLDLLFVEQKYRKMGVGTALLNKIEEISTNLELEFFVHGIEKTNLIAHRLFNNYKKIEKIIYKKKLD